MTQIQKAALIKACKLGCPRCQYQAFSKRHQMYFCIFEEDFNKFNQEGKCERFKEEKE